MNEKKGLSMGATIGIVVAVAFIAVSALVFIMHTQWDGKISTPTSDRVDETEDRLDLDLKIALCTEKCTEKCEKMFPAQNDPNRPEMVATCVNGCTMSCSSP